MKYVYTAIVIILIGIMIYVFWPRKEVIIDNSKLKELRTELKRAETKQIEIIVKAKEDSIKHTIINKAKDEEIARLKRSVRKAKTPHVDTVLIQDPEVGRYAAMLDSIVVSQDYQISELKEQKSEQWASFNQLIAASDSTAQANKELNEFVNKALELENKRLKGQNRNLKIACVAIPLGIVALVLVK